MVELMAHLVGGVDERLEAMEDDHFNLIPIIDEVMKNQSGKKRPIQEMEYTEPIEICEPKRNRPRKVLSSELKETSLERSPKSPLS